MRSYYSKVASDIYISIMSYEYCAGRKERWIFWKSSYNCPWGLPYGRCTRLLFGSPIIGDIFDSIITSILYSITKSKSATAINLIEFIPFVGDFVPVYTLSTLHWISKELRKPKSESTYYKVPQLYISKSEARDFLNRIKRR
jgi:hypothetical protein